MFLKRGSRIRVFTRSLLLGIAFLSAFFVASCKKGEESPGKVLERFFYLLNDGKYRKAAALCEEEIDPDLLDFTYIVSLRFMDRIVVGEEIHGDEAKCTLCLILKDGKELVYYSRTREGKLLPGTMKLKNTVKDKGKSEWKVSCDEFWEQHHWQDITQKLRLNIIAVIEQAIRYRDSTGTLPESLALIWTTEIDTIINPVTGEGEEFVAAEEVKPGGISFYLDNELKELNIKAYDVLGEEIEYYIVSHEPGTEKARLLEFFDVPPRKLSMVIPAYPESEQEKGTEGIVGLNLLIGRDGMVHEVKVEKSVSPVFDSLAVDAVMQSIFSPAKREGKPVAVWYQFPVRFVLEE